MLSWEALLKIGIALQRVGSDASNEGRGVKIYGQMGDVEARGVDGGRRVRAAGGALGLNSTG